MMRTVQKLLFNPNFRCHFRLGPATINRLRDDPGYAKKFVPLPHLLPDHRTSESRRTMDANGGDMDILDRLAAKLETVVARLERGTHPRKVQARTTDARPHDDTQDFVAMARQFHRQTIDVHRKAQVEPCHPSRMPAHDAEWVDFEAIVGKRRQELLGRK